MRPDSLVVSAPGESVITFDRAGRLYSAFLDGRFYRRGVDGRVVEKYTERGTMRRRLDPERAREVVGRALALALAVPGVRKRPLLLDLETDAAAFRRVYRGGVPILPPDVYRALVLQATQGCSYNACLFCRFYKEQTFRVRGLEEFAEHAREVRTLFGAGLSMRRGIFLGDADALVIETGLLERLCRRAAELEPAAGGLYCFGAIFDERPRGRGEWLALADAGLRRVYLGIETGSDRLREHLGKPGSSEVALRLVGSLKEAGIAVGLIFLTGIDGGEDHVRSSADFCDRAQLDGDDFVYLSPLVGSKGGLLGKRGTEQAAALREAVPAGPRVAIYDIRAFVY